MAQSRPALLCCAGLLWRAAANLVVLTFSYISEFIPATFSVSIF